jgi:uncharacterized membrane protein
MTPAGGRVASLVPVTPAQEPSPEEGDGMSGRRRIVDSGRLWVGGIMAGVVGAGIAVVGLLVARGIADVPVFVEQGGKLVNASSWWYAGAAMLAALLATGLLHGLLLGAPRPFTFYGWITGLAVAIAALVPYTTGAKMDSKVATSLINLAIGIAIATIVAAVGRTAASVLDEAPNRPGGPVPGW